MGAERTAAALIVGNELLSGKIADANVVVLARTLRRLGIVFRRVVVVPDELALITADVRALSASHDVVFTSGGVGPTHDDMTLDAVAAAFEVPLVTAPAMDQLLRAYYGARITDDHLRMARVPEGARLVTGPQIPWPAIVMRNVWVLPGVPEVFRMKMPLVERELGGDRPFVTAAVFTTLDEGHLKADLDRVVERFRDVDVGSYPKWGDERYKTKVTFDARDEARVAAARAELIGLLSPDVVVEVAE